MEGFVTAEEKERRLHAVLKEMGSVVVAFSGGVDSAYLAVAAHEALGAGALAVTGESASYPLHQRRMALAVVAQFGIAHRFVGTKEIEDEAYRANNPDRCFHCKTELFTRLRRLAESEGFRCIADGSNADDRTDFRPGRKAAKLLGVRSPLEEADLGKSEIRLLSERLGIPTAHEPASACLSSRIPYFTPVTVEKLAAVERAEDVLRSFGFRQVRVRHHGELARIELAPEELPRALAPELRPILVEEIQKLGFRFVTVDLEGYRRGSLNELLSWPSRSGSRAPGKPTTARAGGSK